MGLLSPNANDISNEVSALLRIIRTHYKNDIKLQITNALCIEEFKLKIIRKNQSRYKFLFLIKIPRDYPFEPIWAQPIIVSKEMKDQFHNQMFQSFKLRPLVDSLITFCHKYDNHNPESLMISFPASKTYGQKEINSKVLIFLSKALSKFSERFPIDGSDHKNQRTIFDCHGFPSNDYYNDMGISMYNYINMLNRLTTGSKRKHNALCSNFECDKPPLRPNSGYGKELLMNRSKEIKRHLSKTLYSKISKRSVSKIYNQHLKEFKACKSNMSKLKNLLFSFDAAPMQGIEIDILEEFSVEIEESYGISLKLFDHVLTVRNDVVNYKFTNAVELSPTLQEEKPFSLKLATLQNTVSKQLLPMHCREIIQFTDFSSSWLRIIEFLFFFTKTEIDIVNFFLERTHPQVNEVEDCTINSPKMLEVSSRYKGFIEEELVTYQIDHSIAVISTVRNMSRERYRNIPKRVFFDSVSIHQSFLKDRIALKMILKEDLSRVELQSPHDRPTRHPLTVLYTDIISEVIQYPKSPNGLFEYTLELNPRLARHRTLLECLGLLKCKHFRPLEVLAPDNYKLHLFFVKEIFNHNGRGVVIKLHKLSPSNSIHKLILEENNHFQWLSETNRSVWCSEIASALSLDLLRVLCGLGKLYVQSLGRKRRMRTEAHSMNCPELAVQRYYFPNEVVQSLQIFEVISPC